MVVRKSILKKIRCYFCHHNIMFHVFATILILWALSLFFVIFWGILISLTDGTYFELNPKTFFPPSFEFENYKLALETIQYNDTNYIKMIWNSVWFSVGCALFRLWSTTLFAYVISKYQFKGRKILYAFTILQLMLPVYGQTASNYKYLESLNLVNSPLFLLSQGAGHGMYFLIMHSYFANISSTFSEAGKIDGANDFVICFKIMLPLARSAILAVGIMLFVTVWNDYQTPIIFLDNYPTLGSGLFRYKTVATYTLNMSIYFAGVFMAALPIAIIFIALSDVLMENITFGGIKE